MNFLNQVSKDIQQILSNDFAQNIIMQTPDLTIDPKTVLGTAGKHSLQVGELGFITINSTKAHCCIPEKNMINAGIVTREINGNMITFAGFLITWTDVSGQTKTYIVQKGNSRPDESVGTVVFTLTDYKN